MGLINNLYTYANGMNKRTVILIEDISQPINEGIKKYSYYLAKYFKDQNDDNQIFSASPNKDIPNIRRLPRNKLFFSTTFFNKISLYKPQLIIYVPNSSSTLMSFIRLKIVSVTFKNAKTVMVSVQARKHCSFSKFLIGKFFSSDIIIVLSDSERIYYENIGMNCITSSVGVDDEKFKLISKDAKQKLRARLGLPINDKIILHVGHINAGRNLQILKNLLFAGYKIVIVGSNCFETDNQVMQGLEKIGFIFITDYIEKIEEYYQASDIYIFPVFSSQSAIEFPLSILEAMSCNIPIVTTRFGGLINSFSESKYFKYFSDEYELLEKINLLKNIEDCDNREIVRQKYTWEGVFKNLLDVQNGNLYNRD